MWLTNILLIVIVIELFVIGWNISEESLRTRSLIDASVSAGDSENRERTRMANVQRREANEGIRSRKNP